ncbi:MAG: hypothetical protein R3E01_16245 [Pirellulaceae bacterium]
MEDLVKQVQRAQRRLNLQTFLDVAVWSLFLFLVAAALAVAAKKIWPLAIDGSWWSTGWLLGSVAVGLIVASVWTWWQRARGVDAAIELDHRFGLKERVSSTLCLTSEERDTEIGQALVDDAVRRVARIDVKEGFRVKTGWWTLLPLLPAVVVIGLVFVPDAEAKRSTEGAEPGVNVKQVKTSTQKLREKIAEKRKRAEEQGLTDATNVFDKLEKGIEELNKKDSVDQKTAMVKLNDIANEIKARKEAMGNPEEVRKQLQDMKDFETGPADRVAKAMQEGDFQAAADEMKDLLKKMQNNELSETEKQALEKQLNQMAEKMRQVANAHEQAKQDLQREMEQRQQNGDPAGAAEIQKKLDQLNRMNPQMQQLQQMAQKLGQCSECMQNGEGDKAAQNLQELADQLSEMQEQLEEMDMMNEALEQLADAKNAMKCGECDGMGCEACQGDAMGLGMGMGQQGDGMGMGEGQGRGARPEQETDTGGYDSQVRAKIGRGAGVVAGRAGGNNIVGDVREEIKMELEASDAAADDPLTDQHLPRGQREHAKQYFDAFAP